nr:zinc finger, CCHC-type [Tanacetum cinerariifolium]
MVQNETFETTKKRMKWENDDYICRGNILNGMSDSLFDIYQNAESAKALWESLESKYIAEDASAKKFLELDNNPKGKNQIRSSSDNMVEGDEAKNFNNNKNKSKFKSGDDKFANKKGIMTCWKCKKTGHMKKDCLSRKGNDGVGSNGSKDPEKQQEPNDYVSMNSIIKSRDAIFDEERFKSIPRPKGMIQPSSSKIAEDQVEGCKWILKRKMKVNESIDKYKARLVIQGFRQKDEIDFFDTYAPVARISTIRLLLALAAIYDLVIHQMDVKTAFLNGDFDEEVYMKQPEGFVMPGHESKCVYSKFDASGKRVIICLYLDDMLIFGTDQDQVNKTKKFLSTKFDMKYIGEAKVILGIRIKRENNDPTMKFRHNKGTLVSQLEYLRAIGCLMYAMISSRPDIAFAIGKLSRYTSNPSALHWQALAGNEAGRLRNLVYEIPLWPKPISIISIRCDSVATLAKAYSQVYNGKSRHLGVRHSMICKLIMNGVIPVEFVRTQLNLADHLTKGLARDLVCKAAIGMGLKST